MENSKLLITQLKERIISVKPILEQKGWHVTHSDFYIGITGKIKKRKDGIILPRKECIVSVYIFNQLNSDGTIEKDLFEVKTHWTTRRKIFSNLDSAWKLFIEETNKYNPNTIKWDDIDNQELQIERGVAGWKNKKLRTT